MANYCERMLIIDAESKNLLYILNFVNTQFKKLFFQYNFQSLILR